MWQGLKYYLLPKCAYFKVRKEQNMHECLCLSSPEGIIGNEILLKCCHGSNTSSHKQQCDKDKITYFHLSHLKDEFWPGYWGKL